MLIVDIFVTEVYTFRFRESPVQAVNRRVQGMHSVLIFVSFSIIIKSQGIAITTDYIYSFAKGI